MVFSSCQIYIQFIQLDQLCIVLVMLELYVHSISSQSLHQCDLISHQQSDLHHHLNGSSSSNKTKNKILFNSMEIAEETFIL